MQPLTPVSVKRPHWVLLCRREALARPLTIKRHDVYGAGVVSYTDDAGEMHVIEEACPHRGASLAGGTVRDSCVVCPYHGLAFGAMTTPARAYDYAALQGLVWVDVAKDLCTQHVMPPYYPEFSTREFRTFGYSRVLEGVNPLVLLEHLVDWRLPGVVPHVRIDRAGPDARARHTYDIPEGTLAVDVAYHVPFTASLRFLLDGVPLALVMYSVLPSSPSRVCLHVHVARASQADAAPDTIARAIDDATARGDEAVLRTVDARQWDRNLVTDELTCAYREAMRRFFPEVVAYCVAG